MTNITITRYYPAENSDYEGNPLITCIPPLTKEHIRDLLTSTVICTDADREQPAHVRQEYLKRIQHFFYPTPEQVTRAKNLWDAICAGYVRQDPRDDDVQSAFDAMCLRMQEKKFGEPRFQFGDLPEIVTIIGTPGCGKTSVPVRMLRALSKDTAFFHPAHGFVQRLYVICSAPNVKTEKSLAWVMYRKLYQAVIDGGGTRRQLTTTGSNSYVLAFECAALVRILNLGVIIIDEIQHWMHRKDGIDNHAVEFLTTLANELTCPILLLGTWRAGPILNDTLFCGRRATAQGSGEARRIVPGKIWTGFMRRLFTMQFTKHVVPCTDTMINVFYEETQGIQDIAVKLMVFAQAAAIASGIEAISKELIEACAKEYLKFVFPALERMRNGAAEDDLVIWDAEPVNPDEFMKRVLAEYALATPKPGSKRRRNVVDIAAAAGLAANALTTMGVASKQQATDIVTHVASEDPNITAPEIVQKVLKSTLRKGPRPTENAAKRPRVDIAMDALEPLDLRRIVYKAKRVGTDCEAALDDLGHLFHAEELEAS